MSKFLTIFILVSSFLTSSLSLAQESATSEVKVDEVKQEIDKEPKEKDQNVKNNGRVEKLEVTGSHIRRTDIEGPSPVLVIDRTQIEKSGMNSVSQILSRSTVSPFGSSSEDGKAYVSLKGIGSGRTLILINGMRAPGRGSSYASGAVSADFVPIAAIERIEVLKDGASATYGSDALGGVVNIITKKGLDGFAFVNKYDMSSNNGSDNNLTSIAYGKQRSNSDFLTSLQFQYQQGSRSSDFDYAKDLNKSIPFSTNYLDDSGNNFLPGPFCTELNEDGACEEKVSPRQVSLPSMNLDWVTDYSVKVGSDITLFSTLMAGYSKDEGNFPNALNTPGVGLGFDLLAAETPTSWNTLPGYSGGDTSVFHRFDDYVNNTVEQNYYAALILGLKGYIGNSDWQWDVTANNQININETNETNLATVSGTKNAFINDTYNPFDLTKRDTTGLGIDAFNRNRANVNWVEAKTNGDLGRFLGFDWATALGTSFAHFDYADHRAADILNKNVMLQSGVAGRGARELYSLFSEFSGVIDNTLELQFSMRGDLYSDFGGTFNPKIAARYQPTKWLTFRTSAGTGFQAPTLQDMNAKVEGYNFLVDQVLCKDPAFGNNNQSSTYCRTQSYSSFQDNNSSLKEERSLTLNIGTVIQPTKNFNVSLDWWYVKVKNTIGTDLNDILRLEQMDPTAPGRYGVNIIRDGGSPTGRIKRIEYRLQNVGYEEVNGVDLEFNYKVPTHFGDFNFSNETTYLSSYYESFYAEFGKQQVLGQFSKPRWRNNLTAGYSFGQIGFQTVVRSIADMEKRVRGLGKVVSITQFDFTLNYDPEWAGEFQLGAINLFNIRPKFDDTYSSKVNGSIFKRNETFFLTYRQDF